jgi:hypothetical protein
MKNVFYIILIAAAVFACDESDIANQGLAIQDLPGYVAFNAPGDDAILPDVETSEDGGTVDLNIENPTGTLVDITIDYSFSGTAEFGVDFNVTGATAAGGSIVMPHNPGDVNNFDNVDLVIELLTDGVADGEKTLTITLDGAQGTDGTAFAVGRGGTDLLKSTSVIIADID